MNAPTTPERYHLRVDDFLLLDRNGAFADFAKTELIDGDIYAMNAQHAGHARAKSRLHVELARRLASIDSDLEALVEVSIRIGDGSVPEPDITLTRWREAGVVPVETVALVVEVSDTTLDIDLGRKADLYAAAGIPEYWVIDLAEERVLMHECPGAAGYRGQLDLPFGERLISATIEGLDLGVVRLTN